MKKITLTLYFLAISIAGMTLFAQSTKYFDKYQAIADSFEVQYQIPSSVMLAIAYFESGGGTSNLAKKSNNHFGMRAGKGWAKYSSDTASYEAFCKLVTRKKFYTTLKGDPDPKKWIYALSRANYAGSSTTWPKKMIYVIRTYKLTFA
jgi:Bax protein